MRTGKKKRERERGYPALHCPPFLNEKLKNAINTYSR
jgi:ribosomal protein L34E